MSKTITVHVPMRLAVRGGRKAILTESEHIDAQPRTKNALLKALAKAHRWRHQIENGEYASIAELAGAKRVNESYACRLFRLSLLAPSIVADVLNGRQKSGLTLKDLTKPFPFHWDLQLTIFQSSTESPKSKTSELCINGSIRADNILNQTDNGEQQTNCQRVHRPRKQC